MNLKRKFFVLLSIIGIFAVLLCYNVKVFTKVTKTTENYIVTEYSYNDSDSLCLVTMQEENGTQEVTFEISKKRYESFDLSENGAVTLDLEKTENTTKYYFKEQRLLTSEEMNKYIKIGLVIIVIIIILFVLIVPEGDTILELVVDLFDLFA